MSARRAALDVATNPTWCIRTGRLTLMPVAQRDLPDLIGLKADPRTFGLLLGGVRDPIRVARELADDIAFWGRHGVGMWSIRETRSDALVGMTGIMERPDGRGMALRFALAPPWWGRGYASEAASAALRFAHDRGHLARVVAVARENNAASRELLAAIGMVLHETFMQHGWRMFLYESRYSTGTLTRDRRSVAWQVPAA